MTGEFLLLWEAGGLHGLGHCATDIILKYPRKTLQRRIAILPDCIIILFTHSEEPSEKADEFCLTVMT